MPSYRDRAWSLALWPGDDTVIAAGTSSGVFLTRDAKNWKKICRQQYRVATRILLAFHPGNSKVLYAGTTLLPWKTTDGGATWESIHTGMLDDSDVFSIVVDPKHLDHVMASARSALQQRLTARHWAKLTIPDRGSAISLRRSRIAHEGVVFAGTTGGLRSPSTAGTPGAKSVRSACALSHTIRASMAASFLPPLRVWPRLVA